MLVVCVVVLGTVTGVAAAQGPSISVSMNGDSVSEDETVRTENDPEMELTVEAESQLQLVEVRVDGNIRESFEPGEKSFSKTLTLGLDEGEHTVKVIASGEETSTFETTVLKDNSGPFVEYTNPFSTDLGAPPEGGTVSDANVTLAGDLVDDVGVETITITRSFYYSFGGRTQDVKKTYTVEDPGDSFSTELFLGDGENELTAIYKDKMGNQRRHDFTITVDDRESPTMELTLPSRTGAPEVRMLGTIRDNVKLQKVELILPHDSDKQIVTKQSPEPNPDRLSVEINQKVTLEEGENTIAINATDNSGNSRVKEFDVTFDPNVKPRITIDEERTRFEGGSLAVRGRVDRGEISAVTLESIDAASGEIVSIVKAYSGQGTSTRVDFDETLSVADGKTRIRVLVTDSQGDQHDRTFTVEPTTQTVLLEGAGVEGSAATPTPAAAGGATPTATESGGATPTQTASGGTNAESDIQGTAPQSDATETPNTEAEETPSANGPGFTAGATLLAALLVGLRLAFRE